MPATAKSLEIREQKTAAFMRISQLQTEILSKTNRPPPGRNQRFGAACCVMEGARNRSPQHSLSNHAAKHPPFAYQNAITRTVARGAAARAGQPHLAGEVSA